MANSLGALVVSLGLDAVEYITGWTKAEYQTKKSLEAMTRSALGFQRTIKDVAAALGVGFSVRAFVGLIESTIEAADHLENLSKATGISVEQLGGLGFAAKQTGGDLDSMADAFKKFNVNAASAAAGNEKNLEVFNKLGITLTDLKTLSPDQLFIKAADAFASFNEGVNKSALGAAAFGKSYQAIIPTLDQGGQKLQENIEFFNKFGGVTTEVARQASDFNTEMVKLNLLGGSFARALTADLLPPMKVLVEELLHAKENSNLFAIAAKFVADELTADAVTVLRLAQGYEQLQRAVGSAAERIKALKSGDFGKAFSNLPDEEEAIKRINDKYDELINKVKNASNFPNVSNVADTLFPDLGQNKKRDAPGLIDRGAKDDPTRKLLEAQLSAIKAITAQEKAVLQNREQFLQAEFDRGELSIQEFYANKQAAQNEDLKITTENYRQEIAAIDNFIKNSATARDKAEGEKQRVDATSRQTLAVIQAAGRAQAAIDDQTRATKEYTDQVTELNAKMLELAGNTRAAAEIRFDAQNQLFLDRAKKGGDTQTVANVAALREQVGLTANLSRAQQDYSNTLDAVAISAARIDFLRSTGALTEIEALNQRSALTRANIENLNKEIDAYEKLALAIKDPQARAKAINDIAQMRLNIDQLAASSDLLAKKFNDAFADAFADTIFKLTTGVESLTDAVKDFEKQLVGAVSRIAAQNIAESIFKPGSTGGSGFDIGAIFAKLLSGSGGGTSAPVDLGQFFAFGGMPPVGMASVVGERGPELFVPKVAGTIIPNSVLTSRRSGRSNVTVNVNVLPGASRASADQAASAMAREIRRAEARTG